MSRFTFKRRSRRHILEAEIENARHNLTRILKRRDRLSHEDLLRPCKHLLTAVAAYYTWYTGTTVALCVRAVCHGATVVTDEIENKEVFTLVRDLHSRDGRLMDDKSDMDTIQKHRFGDNTDYMYLANGHEYYLTNYLPLKMGYLNTASAEYGLTLEKNTPLRKRVFLWALPYRSAIVVPILRPKPRELFGFLCMDSDRMGTFRKKDVMYLQGLAKELLKALVRIYATTPTELDAPGTRNI